jgi:hypothetical protein
MNSSWSAVLIYSVVSLLKQLYVALLVPIDEEGCASAADSSLSLSRILPASGGQLSLLSELPQRERRFQRG